MNEQEFLKLHEGHFTAEYFHDCEDYTCAGVDCLDCDTFYVDCEDN